MQGDINPPIPSLKIHDLQSCPLVPRVQALQTELSYYKAICQAYQTGKLKPQGNSRRINIHKNYSREIDRFKLMVPETQHIQEYKQSQIKFSEQIDKKMKKGVQKGPDTFQGAMSMTPHITGESAGFAESKQDIFYLQEGMSKTVSFEDKAVEEQEPAAESQQEKEKEIEMNEESVERSSDEAETIECIHEGVEDIRIVVRPPDVPIQELKQHKPSINLISDLCLFGCSEKEMKSLSGQKINEVTPSLLFSMYDLNNKQYYDQVAKYIFPNGLYAKTLRQERVLSEVNQILLQNIKKHSNFIYQLKSELKMEDIKGEQRQLLQWINPSLKLYCLSIVINDFTIIDPDPILSDKQKSVEDESKSPSQEIPVTNRSDYYVPKPNKRKESRDLKNFNIYSNKKILSIFTFFPFFEFFETILIGIINALKVEKLGIYQNKLETIFQIDSSFLLSQLQTVYLPIVNEINTTIMSPGLDYQFTLGVDLVKISTNGTKLIDACIGAWLFPVLKLFDKNTFCEIFSAILFEQQVIFVCDNLHMLSYSIYLFTEVLIRPFRYQHSAIYIVSYWDLLDAPTPIVLGVNKGSQWLQETQLREGHIYVQLGEQATIIDKRKEHKKVKSQKFRKIVSAFFKSIDRDTSFFKEKKKRDGVEYNMVSTKHEKQLSMLFISSVNVFMKEELVDVIPSSQFMEHVKAKFRWGNKAKNQDAATIISQEIIREILRVRKEKDPFVEKFLRTQIFLTFLFQLVQLED